MNTHFYVLIVLIALLVVPVAGAQENGTAETEVSYEGQIDQNTRIVDWNYDDKSEQFHVTIESDIPQQISTADALGGLGDGGVSKPDRQIREVPSGTTNLTISAEEFEGYAAVSIAARYDAASISTETGATSRALIGGPWSVRDVQIAVLISVVIGVISEPLTERLIESALERDRIL